MRRLMLACALLLAACATTPPFDYSQTPIAIAPIEGPVSDAEVLEAVTQQVAAAPVCLRLPVVWWETMTPYTVRFGPEQWRGEAIPADAEQRLDDFVAMGFWTKAALPEAGERVYQYTLTELGERGFRGHPYRGGMFCAPGERRLLRVVSVERLPAARVPRHAIGFYPPKSLRVLFEWTGAERPSWMPEALLERYRARLPDSSSAHRGYQRLFRVWLRDRDPLENAPQSGALEPFCYDNVHNRPDECVPYFNAPMPES